MKFLLTLAIAMSMSGCALRKEHHARMTAIDCGHPLMFSVSAGKLWR
jgi:hypothetical protein